MGFEFRLISFLEGKFAYVGQTHQLRVRLYLSLSKLIEHDVESALIAKGIANRMILFLKKVWSFEIAMNHGIWGNAFIALIFDEKEVSWIDPRHNSIIWLESPADAEGIIGESRCVSERFWVYALQIVGLVAMRVMVDIAVESWGEYYRGDRYIS